MILTKVLKEPQIDHLIVVQVNSEIKKVHECGLIGRCYICGKTPEEFSHMLQISNVLSIFNQELSQNLSETQILYSNFVLRLQNILHETQSYKPEINYSQFISNRDLYKKMMPFGEDLISFCPDEDDFISMGKKSKGRDSCSFGDMRLNIQHQLDNLSQGQLTPFLRKHNPILSQKLELYYSEAQSANTTVFESIHFTPFTFEYFCDNKGEIVVPYSQQSLSGYYSVRSYDEQGNLISGSQMVKNVLQIKFKYEMCPICASQSLSSFKKQF